MRKTFRTIILSLLLVPGMAMGQEHRGPDRGPGQQHGGNGGNRPAPGAQRPGPGGGQPGVTRPSPTKPSPGRPTPGRPGEGSRPTPGRPEHGGNRPSPGKPGHPGQGTRPPQRPGVPGRPGGPGKPGYHRPGEGRPPSFRPIRGPVFRYPHGYRYRRWTIGSLLPSLFLSSTYIYSGWAGLGLEPPPPGYYWVRYGPDMLLVQRGTRRVVDVIYGAFY